MGEEVDIESLVAELPDDIKREYQLLNDVEKRLLLKTMTTPGLINLLYDMDFREIPVPPIEFFTNPYYIGKGNVWDDKNQIGLYPIWLDEMCYVLDPKNEIYEWVLSGSLGCGKSTVTLLLALYKLYWLNCLRDPHQYFSLMATAPIEFFLFNINLTTARDVALGRFEELLNQSPYFREKFPTGRRKKKGGKFGNGEDEPKIELPPHFHIVEGSKATHFISRDIIFGMFDEANFVQQPKGTGLTYDSSSRAFSLYIGLRNRITTRFMKQGKLFGLLCLISSAATRYDFLENHKKAVRNDPHVHISEFALYDVKPWNYSGKKFKVLLGNEQANSKIVSDDFEPVGLQKVIEVPVEHKDAYEKDISTALKEFSGIPSEVSSPLIPVRDQIAKTVNPKREHPFRSTNIIIGHLNKISSIEQHLRAEQLACWRDGVLSPKYYPKSPRYIHVDLSQSRCATGISMGCVSGTKTNKYYNFVTEKEMISVAPIIWLDFVLQILPPDPPEEVSFAKVRQFIKYLRDVLNYNILTVSYDGWQCLSGDTLILTNRGLIEAKNIVEGDIVQSRIGPRPVKKCWSFGRRPTLIIETNDGHKIEVTENHKLESLISWKMSDRIRPKIRRSGKLLSTTKNAEKQRKWKENKSVQPVWGWKMVSDLKVGDILHAWDKKSEVSADKYVDLVDVVRNKHTNKNIIFPTVLNEEFAEWLGMVWSDGNIHKDYVAIASHEDGLDSTLLAWSRVIDPHLVYIYKKKDENGYSLRVSSRLFKQFLDANGLVKSRDFIPEPILKSPSSVQAAFVRGLFTGDGNVRKTDGRCSLHTTSKVWSEYVQNFLRMAFGIESKITKQEKTLNGKRCLDCYIVSIRGPRIEFLENVGFISGKKLDLLKQFSDVMGERRWTKIVSITHSEADVFDFEIEEDHSYIANGIISHNSVDSAQILENEGFTTEVVSLDKTPDAYLALRGAIMEERIDRYKYEPFEKELAQLQLIQEGNKVWVEKPPNSFKDTSDAVAGVAWHCAKQVQLTGDSDLVDVFNTARNIVNDFVPLPIIIG